MSSIERATGKREIAIALCLFSLGFVLVAAVLHQGMRNPQYLHADIRSEKMALLRQWSGTVYSASFGSSHVHNGFDPRVFDSILAGTAAQTRTVNLAIAGGSQTEQRMTALEFLDHLQPPPRQAADSPRACIVLLELGAGANFTSDHLVHPRAINIYDWPTARFVQRLTTPRMGLRQRLGRTGYAWAAMALHYINVGMLSSRLFTAPLDQEMLRDETADDRRGILVLPPIPGALPKLTELVRQAPPQPRMLQAELLPGNAELADELQDQSPVANLQVVYFVMPMLHDLFAWTHYPPSVGTAHGPVPILNLAQPALHPELYQPRLWRDDAHLTEEGAQLATRNLSEELKAWYATHGGGPPPCGKR